MECKVESRNRKGICGIVVETFKVGMVFEIKYAHDDKLELTCELGMNQMVARNYSDYFSSN